MDKKYTSIMEKCSEKTDDFIMLEKVQCEEEGEYYQVLVNGTVKYSDEEVKKAKQFYKENENIIQ